MELISFDTRRKLIYSMIFMQFTLGNGIQIRKPEGPVECHFQETDQLVDGFSLDQGNRELPFKNVKESNRRV